MTGGRGECCLGHSPTLLWIESDPGTPLRSCGPSDTQAGQGGAPHSFAGPRSGLLLPFDQAPVAVQREILALPVLHLATRPFHCQLADLTLLAQPEELARIVCRAIA